MTASNYLKGFIQRPWVRRSIKWGFVLLAVGSVALEGLRFYALRSGVRIVELPASSEIARLAMKADYVDAYKVAMPGNVSINSLAAANLAGTHEIVRTEHEVVAEGWAPGLRFLVSHHFERGEPDSVTLGTAVFYESVVGKIYFFFVRPVHRRIVPFALLNWRVFPQ